MFCILQKKEKMDEICESMDIENDVIPDKPVQSFSRPRMWNRSDTQSTQNLNILVVGATFVGIKLCKKLVSSKVKSVTLLCEYETEQEDVDSLFTLSHSDFGTEDISVLTDLRISNPDVQFHIENASITEKQIPYVLQFDAVVMTSACMRKVTYLDELCRRHKTKFFYTCTFGKFGFSLHNVVCFDVLNVYMYSLKEATQAQKMKHYCYIMFKVLHQFMDMYHRQPNASKYMEDSYNLRNICNEVLQKRGVPLDYLPSTYVEKCCEENEETSNIVADYVILHMTNGLYEDADICIQFFDHVSNNEVFCDLSEYITKKLVIE